MSGIFTDLLRIRNLREERSERALKVAQEQTKTAEQAVVQAEALLERFTCEMPAKIDAEYAQVEKEAQRNKGVPLHKIQSFRSFETHMHAQREGLRVALVEKQQALKEAHDAREVAHEAFKRASAARLKIELLQQQEQVRQRKQQERSEEKLLEEFKPQSILAQLR